MKDGGYFAVGNALGEAHPIVAEGISMPGVIGFGARCAGKTHALSAGR